MGRKVLFLVGVFILCMCVLMLQIVQTRVLSVISYYHLAFFAISMAMFGMTAGSLIVYFNRSIFRPDSILENLSWIAAAFGIAVALSTVSQVSTVIYAYASLASPVMTVLMWLKMIAILLPPYVLAGMGISLALTRSPYPVGQVYGVDLLGAAAGCLGVLVLLNAVDAVSAMLAVAALGAAAAWAFAAGAGGSRLRLLPNLVRRLLLLDRPAVLALGLAALALGNSAIHPRGLVLAVVKDGIETPGQIDELRWNSYSRVRADKSAFTPPHMWAASKAVPDTWVDQRALSIDGDAGTAMYGFKGDVAALEFLKYDMTNLAYYIRNKGRAAVIGVGGGRDLLSAYAFGFRDVTGVELNPIFVDFLERRFRDFNNLAGLPGMRLVVDEARSWFARASSEQPFDLVQMSMIDTWAATGAGAFSLSENGLYTVEGWRNFISRLAPRGVFTVSRWYSPEDVDETGRLLSLAKAALFAIGVRDPGAHLFMSGHGAISTLLLSRAPFSADDLTRLHETVDRLGYSVLVAPGRPPASPLLQRIMDASDTNALHELARDYPIDISPSSDERPFFFNQLRITHPSAMWRASGAAAGIINGNLIATMTLLIIVALSGLLVIATVVLPALPSVRRSPAPLAAVGTGYFLLIGLGFMFVEIGIIQRLSVFLGHPIYGLAIGLFGIILSTGIGSLASERLPIVDQRGAFIWSGLLVLVVASVPFWFPALAVRFEGASVPVRAAVALLAVVPSGVLMGFGFPTGIRLANAIDQRPTPWFWAINGAAGVLAASIAVVVSITFSISVSLWLGAACYALVGGLAVRLVNMLQRESGEFAGQCPAPAE